MSINCVTMFLIIILHFYECLFSLFEIPLIYRILTYAFMIPWSFFYIVYNLIVKPSGGRELNINSSHNQNFFWLLFLLLSFVLIWLGFYYYNINVTFETRLSKSGSYVGSLKVDEIVDRKIGSWIVRSYIFSDLKQKTHW